MFKVNKFTKLLDNTILIFNSDQVHTRVVQEIKIFFKFKSWAS